MKKTIHYFLLYALVFGFCAKLKADVPPEERQALSDFYKALDGPNWEEDYRWPSDLSKVKNMGDLFGVTTSERERDNYEHVIAISLPNQKLKGQIPLSFFKNLKQLKVINLSGNLISGQFPHEFVSMMKDRLVYLNISRNPLSGEIPDFSQCPNLRYLDISMLYVKTKNHPELDRTCYGKLPDFSKLSKLQYFDASFSRITGEIIGVGSCRDLEYFVVMGNKITGTLPSDFTKCTKLKTLVVQDNQLTGEIPDLSSCVDLGARCFEQPGRLFLSENKFTGHFPKWILSLTKLQYFGCFDNELSGEVPADLSPLEACEIFYIGKNKFTGPLPTKLGAKMSSVEFSSNKFSGTIPDYRAPELSSFQLKNNDLKGKVPPFYKHCKNLGSFGLGLNHFRFVDLKEWKSWANEDNAIFRFGIQKPYAPTKRVKVKAGETVTLKADYPGPAIGDEKYQWADAATKQPLPGENKPTLIINNITKEQAHPYYCLISTNKLHKVVAGEIPPMVSSARFEVEVDGYFQNLNDPSQVPLLKVYPSVAKNGKLFVCCSAHTAGYKIYNTNGQLVMQSHNIPVSIDVSRLPQGFYIIQVLVGDNQIVAKKFLIQ